MLLVAIVGLGSTALLVSDPVSQYDLESDTQAVLTATEKSEATEKKPIERIVATTQDIPEAPPKKRQIVLKVDCVQDRQTIITDSPRLRLYAANCGELKDVETLKSQIKNETNGFVATLFHPKDQLFTTDFINLNEGENKIVIHLQDGKESIERVIKVSRTPSSTD